MVAPVTVIALYLLFAFLFPVIEKLGRRAAAAAGGLAALLAAAAAVSWIITTAAGGGSVVSETAGFPAPLSIRLAVSTGEAAVLAVINLIAAFTVFYLGFTEVHPWTGRRMVLLFVLFLGANGLVMTRDIFNVFVFMEVSAVSLFGILSVSRDRRIYEAGFKYMIAGGLASIFYLIGTIFIYRFTGTLSLDVMTGIPVAELHGTAGVIAIGFFLTAILIELKPVFANGWALDTYEAADNGTAAVISAVTTTAMAAVLIKVLPFVTAGAPVLAQAVPAAGAVSFLGAGIMALPQSNVRRMLGLSSVGQTGLVLLIAGTAGANPLSVSPDALLPGLSGTLSALGPYTAALIVLLTHGLAKAVLFWITDYAGLRSVKTGGLRSRPVLYAAAGIAVFALLGLPPFPSFWAKWAVLSSLAGSGAWLVIGVILSGSLLEAAYLGRWFLSAGRHTEDRFDTLSESVPEDGAVPPGAVPAEHTAAARKGSVVPVLAVVCSLILIAAGTALGGASGVSLIALSPVGALLLFSIFDLIRLPKKMQLLLAVAAVTAAGIWYLPQTSGAGFVFAAMFLAGTGLALFPFWRRTGSGDGTAGLLVSLSFALVTIVSARSSLELFLAWELMTLFSLLLIAKGSRAGAGSYRYLMFSLFSAYLLVTGLLLMPFSWNGLVPASAAAGWAGPAVPGAAAFILAACLIKLGNIGVHLWLPAGYAEAPDDVSPLLSGVLSKAGLFVLLAAGGALSFQLVPALSGTVLGGIPISGIAGWVGAATALAGALMALFQEDIKYSLAYSSMGQMGYMVLAFAMLSHLGHITGLYLAVIHLMVKLVLWTAVLGVIQQTGTRLMYQMGGLVKKMPLTFISVLFGIIVVSGVPPLAGFGGKWLLYTALLERGWYLQAGLAFFASAVAFLYLYRLIHSIFLGQPKDELAQVKEAPFLQLLPQLLLLAALMGVSMFPNLLLKPLQTAVEPMFAATVRWEGYRVISSLGYWNGNAVMYVTMGVFMVPLIWLLIVNGRKVTRVSQFNIVYAAERPYKPETTHYGFNFFGHYRKALGGLAAPWGERFWTGLGRFVRTVGDGLRRWNTGNPQTYGFQILLFLVIILLAAAGGLS